MKKISGMVVFVLLVLWIIVGCTQRGDPKIKIEGAKFALSPMMKNAAAAFMVITNDGKADDRITECSVKEFPSIRGELHDVVNGKMEEIREIKVPAGKMVVLKKGSLHLMFFDVPGNIEKESITLIIKFEKSGIIEVTASVQS